MRPSCRGRLLPQKSRINTRSSDRNPTAQKSAHSTYGTATATEGWTAMNPYPDWLSPGDNAWQLVAATLVGLMSIPGIAVLYGGLVQKKWAVNTMLMAFTGFSLVLVVWVLWGFKMGFGETIKLFKGIPVLRSVVGIPHTILGTNNMDRAVIPLLDGNMPKFNFSETTLAYFQFVFAAITPLLFLGSVV